MIREDAIQALTAALYALTNPGPLGGKNVALFHVTKAMLVLGGYEEGHHRVQALKDDLERVLAAANLNDSSQVLKFMELRLLEKDLNLHGMLAPQSARPPWDPRRVEDFLQAFSEALHKQGISQSGIADLTTAMQDVLEKGELGKLIMSPALENTCAALGIPCTAEAAHAYLRGATVAKAVRPHG